MPKSFASQFVKQRKHLNGNHPPPSLPLALAPQLVLIISTKVTIWLYRKHLNLMCVDFASLAIFCIILHNPFVCGRLAKAAAAAAAAVASAAAAATCGVYVTCNFIAFACFIHSLPPLLTSFLSASYSSFPAPLPHSLFPPLSSSLPPADIQHNLCCVFILPAQAKFYWQ